MAHARRHQGIYRLVAELFEPEDLDAAWARFE
jgi:hypothetical protein